MCISFRDWNQFVTFHHETTGACTANQVRLNFQFQFSYQLIPQAQTWNPVENILNYMELLVL